MGFFLGTRDATKAGRQEPTEGQCVCSEDPWLPRGALRGRRDGEKLEELMESRQETVTSSGGGKWLDLGCM